MSTKNTYPSPSGGFYTNQVRRKRISDYEKASKLSAAPNLMFKSFDENHTLPEINVHDLSLSASLPQVIIPQKNNIDLRQRRNPDSPIHDDSSISVYRLASAPKYIPPPGLVNSFAAFLPPQNLNPPVTTAEMDTQTDLPLIRQHFENLTEYQKWVDEEVEPFLKGLRKAVMRAKPAVLQSYVSAYCEAIAMQREPPETITSDPVPKEKKARAKSKRNLMSESQPEIA